MKFLNLKTVSISLVLAFIISNIIWHFIKPGNLLGYPVVSVVLLQTLLFFLGFLYGLVVCQLRTEKKQGAGPSKQIDVYRVTLQIFITLLLGTIYVYPELYSFFRPFGIILMIVGAILYGKTGDKLYRTMLLWGILLLALMYVIIIFFGYGIDTLIPNP